MCGSAHYFQVVRAKMMLSHVDCGKDLIHAHDVTRGILEVVRMSVDDTSDLLGVLRIV